jgi:uracil-DNA glycosylase
MPARKYFPEDWVNAIGLDVLNSQLAVISSVLIEHRKDSTILPLAGDPLLFQAFRETSYDNVKVVILGQDPYHDGAFNGLAFGNGSSTEFKTKGISPSLRNILVEVERTEGIKPNPNLYAWARQGVLLINTAHTVLEGVAGSHLELWREFTDLVLAALCKKDDLVWMLWGSKAQAFLPSITNKTHCVIQAGHPSPLNNTHPFVGCNCFQECNNQLKAKKYELIVWK